MLKSNIPFIDLRGKTQTDLLRAFPDQAAQLLASSRRTLGWFSYALSAVGLIYSDRRSHRWLKRAGDPYLHEIETAAGILEKKGVYTLNLAYEWGCTSGAYAMGEGVQLLRVLDWPFPALGRHLVVALQKGAAGEYYNVTWPALSGMYQGVAPGRFACAINQAPMKQYGLGFLGDWLVGRLVVNTKKSLPPAHLLRHVFENARGYLEARHMLSTFPLAVPAIFVLTGTKPGEGCVIERLEDSVEIRDLSAGQSVSSANEFVSRFSQMGRGWRPRALDSAGRYQQSQSVNIHDLAQDQFGWLRPPILNSYTRLALKADAATGSLMVQGFEGQSEVTNLFSVSMPQAKEA